MGALWGRCPLCSKFAPQRPINRRAHSFVATDGEVAPALKVAAPLPPSLQILEPPLNVTKTTEVEHNKCYLAATAETLHLDVEATQARDTTPDTEEHQAGEVDTTESSQRHRQHDRRAAIAPVLRQRVNLQTKQPCQLECTHRVRTHAVLLLSV